MEVSFQFYCFSLTPSSLLWVKFPIRKQHLDTGLFQTTLSTFQQCADSLMRRWTGQGEEAHVLLTQAKLCVRNRESIIIIHNIIISGKHKRPNKKTTMLIKLFFTN